MTTVPLDIRRSLLRQHGNFALAYSVTFQPGLEHFGDDGGFLSYKTVGNTALVLSNPVAAPAKRKALIKRFLEEKGDVCFWQISWSVAEILAGLGCSINEMGTESHINLANYNFAGPAPAKRNLRRAYNRMLDCGYTTRECPTASLNLQELEAVSVKCADVPLPTPIPNPLCGPLPPLRGEETVRVNPLACPVSLAGPHLRNPARWATETEVGI